jgi:hypothetical protein
MIKLAYIFTLILLASTSFAASLLFSITEGKHEDDRIFDIYRERSEPDILYSLESNCRAIKNELECFDANKKKSTYPKQSALTFNKKIYANEGKLTLEDYYDPSRTPDDKRTPQQRAYDRNMKKAWGSDTPGNLVIKTSSFVYLQPAERWARETGLSISEINKKGSFINFFCEPKSGSRVCSKGYPGQSVQKIRQMGEWIETSQGWILQSQITN